MLRKSTVVALLTVMLGVLFACSHNQEGKPGRAESPKTAAREATGPRYTAYNLWYERPEALSCINYQRGAIIPAGTRVNNVEARGHKIRFMTADGGAYTVTFNAKYHPGLSVVDFEGRMFTSKDFDQLTAQMSPAEIDCIKAGAIKAGVSKACVLATYGYPPEHITPSLNSNRWIYWENRFRQEAVNFDAEGRTTGPTEPAQSGREPRSRRDR